ncbi:hypothetical protein AAFC00_002586 [Neodothiora populina]|uniref:mRNA stability protein n=1 Tax=Neodothiora populina TaxID=2781224 RepID=A0ABR3P8A9_9PEZI
MNPHQKNKVDVNSLSPDEQRLFRMYGKLPDKKNLLQHKLKGQERKYFDSGDYAMSKAGKASDAGLTNIGVEHPSPDTIPHLSSSSPHSGPNGTNNGLSLQPTQSHQMAGLSGSPVKESSFLQRGMSIDDPADAANAARDAIDKDAESVSPPPQVEGMPIRQ